MTLVHLLPSARDLPPLVGNKLIQLLGRRKLLAGLLRLLLQVGHVLPLALHELLRFGDGFVHLPRDVCKQAEQQWLAKQYLSRGLIRDKKKSRNTYPAC